MLHFELECVKIILEDNKLVCEYTGSKRVDYLYDGNGILYGLIYNGNKYFYLRDHLANILGIIDSSGNLVVSYDYSAYGNLKSITGSMANTLGKDNHMRYKGYYFDEETGFYYCKSRYYVPEWCRWLNADNPSYLKPYSATGNNLFAYCENKPVMYMDESGRLLKLAAFIGLVIAGVVALTGCARKKSDKLEYHVASDENSKESGKVNYFITSEVDEEPSIRIYDSHEIRSEAQKREILEYIINTDEGKLKGLSKDNIDYYINEWTVHNAAYHNPGLVMRLQELGVEFGDNDFEDISEIKKRSSPVDLDANDKRSKWYTSLGSILALIY